MLTQIAGKGSAVGQQVIIALVLQAKLHTEMYG